MKKFTQPKMDIEMFLSENILTTSGTAPASKSAYDAASASLNSDTTLAGIFGLE